MDTNNKKSLTQKIIEYLMWHPNARPSEIADYLGVSPRLVRAVLSRLRARGLVARTDKGYILKKPLDSASVAQLAGEVSEAGGAEAEEPEETAKQVETKHIEAEEAKNVAQQPQVTQSVAASPTATASTVSVDVKSVVDRVEQLENRIKSLENIVNELKNVVENLKSSKPIDIETKKSDIHKLFIEALDLIKMALEAIETGDTHSLSNTVNELEEVIDKLRKAVSGS